MRFDFIERLSGGTHIRPWACLFFFLLASGPMWPRATAAQSAPAEASAHHQRAVQRYREGAYTEALRELDLAEQLHPAPILEYNRGLVYRKMGDAAAALTHLERYLALSPDLSATKRTEVQEVISELRAKVARITLDGAPAGAEVQVDGHAIGTTPLEHFLWLNPGSHTVALQMGDASPYVEHVAVNAAELRAVTPQLADGHVTAGSSVAAPQALPTASAVELTDDGKQARSDLPLILGWSGSGALVLGSIVAGAVAYRDYRRVEEWGPTDGPEDQQALKTTWERKRTLALVSDALAIAGVAVAAVTLWSTLSRDADEGTAAVALDVGLGHVQLRGQY